MRDAAKEKASLFSRMKEWRPNFFVCHLSYFVFVGFLGSLVFAGTEGPSLAYIDALFTSFSALTVTGLSSVNICAWSVESQAALMILMTAGSTVFLSVVPSVLRLFYMTRCVQAEFTTTSKLKRWVNSSKGAELRALRALTPIVLVYYFGFLALGTMALGFHFTADSYAFKSVLNGINPWYFAVFHVCSAFNNCGFALLVSSFTEFAEDDPTLIIVSVLIIAGNVGYPVFLRIFVWAIYNCQWFFEVKVLKRTWIDKRSALRYLLDHPRRVFTHLFSAFESLVLFVLILIMTGAEIVCYYVLEADNSFMVAYFQAVSTRTAGFSIVDMMLLNTGPVVIYTYAMYLSAYPQIFAIRKSGRDEKRKGVHLYHSSRHVGFSNWRQAVHASSDSDGDTNVENSAEMCVARNRSNPSVSCDTLSTPYPVPSPVSEPSAAAVAQNQNSGSEDSTSAGSCAHEREEQVPSNATETAISTSDVGISPHVAADRKVADVLTRRQSANRLLQAAKENVESFALNASKDAAELVIRDLKYISVAMLVVAVVENSAQFSTYNIVFELFSAYGTVGLSLGYPGSILSYSGSLFWISKLAVICIMLLGRHRGLPSSIDSAVQFKFNKTRFDLTSFGSMAALDEEDFENHL
eukprot:ANDGO_01840.mRNA.1 Low-affinity potassium transport protein